MTMVADVRESESVHTCRLGTRHLQLLPGEGGVKSLQAPRTVDRSETLLVTRHVSSRGFTRG